MSPLSDEPVVAKAHTGFFNISTPTEASGRAHMLDIECTLCKEKFEINLQDIKIDAVAAAEYVASRHICRKTPKQKVSVPVKMKPHVQRIEEAGDQTREQRLKHTGEMKGQEPDAHKTGADTLPNRGTDRDSSENL